MVGLLNCCSTNLHMWLFNSASGFLIFLWLCYQISTKSTHFELTLYTKCGNSTFKFIPKVSIAWANSTFKESNISSATSHSDVQYTESLWTIRHYVMRPTICNLWKHHYPFSTCMTLKKGYIAVEACTYIELMTPKKLFQRIALPH